MNQLSNNLQALSEAHGPQALARAFAVLQGTVRTARRAGSQQWGALALTFAESMRIWDAQKADGIPLQARQDGLQRTLRVAWPFTREWKFLCTCGDVGLQIAHCAGDATCGRSFPHLPHMFGTPCWCQCGVRFRPKPKSADDFQSAGKSARPTRVGR